jgi:P-type Cu2+ transporter
MSGMTEVNHSQHQTHDDHAEHGQAGHGGHGDHVAQFRRMFWTMLALAIPTRSARNPGRPLTHCTNSAFRW